MQIKVDDFIAETFPVPFDFLTWFTDNLFPKWQAWAAANPGGIDAEKIYDGAYS